MRVRTDAKREAILDIAAQAFMDLGYDGASMAEIALRVGGSKATLYGYFPSKEDLFVAMIYHKLAGEFEPTFEHLPLHAKEDPKELLNNLGEKFVDTILKPEAVALKRLIFSQTKLPKVIEEFCEEGAQKLRGSIESYLKAATKEGKLAVKNVKVATQHLMALYEAEINGREISAIGKSIPRQQVKQMVARAVDVFIAAYGC